jgi:hypothetical protein
MYQPISRAFRTRPARNNTNHSNFPSGGLENAAIEGHREFAYLGVQDQSDIPCIETTAIETDGAIAYLFIAGKRFIGTTDRVLRANCCCNVTRCKRLLRLCVLHDTSQ